MSITIPRGYAKYVCASQDLIDWAVNFGLKDGMYKVDKYSVEYNSAHQLFVYYYKRKPLDTDKQFPANVRVLFED